MKKQIQAQTAMTSCRLSNVNESEVPMQYIFTLDKEQVCMILSALRLKVETWYAEADAEYSAAQR